MSWIKRVKFREKIPHLAATSPFWKKLAKHRIVDGQFGGVGPNRPNREPEKKPA